MFFCRRSSFLQETKAKNAKLIKSTFILFIVGFKNEDRKVLSEEVLEYYY
jgi:hypothetical protein